MSCRHYIWAIILLVLQCSSIFDRRNDFEKALDHYQKTNLEKAVHHFTIYYTKHPASDTTLYYLHDCYKKMGNHTARIEVLERLVDLGSNNEQVYTVLYQHYQSTTRYDKLFNILTSAPQTVRTVFDSRYILTRKLYAELLVGALGVSSAYTDPIAFIAAKNYMPFFLDGMFHKDDTITMGNLIVMNDNLIAPGYPKQFFPTTYIPDQSFLYLPYMRLIDTGILIYNKDLNPNAIAPLSSALRVIENMKKRGFFDQNR